MNSRLVQIAVFNSEVEADYVRSVLRENGIQTFIDGGTTNTMLSHVGSALGGVRLLTSSNDAAAARLTMQSILHDHHPQSSPWFCGYCQQEVDAGFDICWSCGGERAEVGTAAPALDAELVPPEILPRDNGKKIDPARDLANPYCPPSHDVGTPSHGRSEAPQAWLSTQEVSDIIARANRAAWIGFILLPMLSFPYAMYLLLISSRYSVEFSSSDRRRWNRAFAATLLGSSLWLFGFYLWYFEINVHAR